MDALIAQQEAIRLLNEKGLTQKGWGFKWDNAKTRLGSCSYFKKAITLSRSFVQLNEKEDVFNTIKHEVAHALVDPGVHHGYLWKIEAKKLGLLNPQRLNKTAKIAKGKYIATCSCGIQHRMYRRSRIKKICRYCRERLTFCYESDVVTPTPEPVVKNVFGEEVESETGKTVAL